MSNFFQNSDCSEYLIHIVGDDTKYESFLNVLAFGKLEAINPFGYKRYDHQKKAVCFSETPPQFLQKLFLRKGHQGIAFKKDFLLKKGAQRVWYVEKNSVEQYSLERLSNSLMCNDREDFLNLTPFIDVAGIYNGIEFQFDWEREWRLLADLSFEVDDVSFLILRSEYHDSAREFFEEAENNEFGPNYNCPFYDPITGRISYCN